MEILKEFVIDTITIVPIAAVLTCIVVLIGMKNEKFRNWIEKED